MLLINNNNSKINIIDRKLSKSIILFKIKINIIKNKTSRYIDIRIINNQLPIVSYLSINCQLIDSQLVDNWQLVIN